jgi:hypothetical protein
MAILVVGASGATGRLNLTRADAIKRLQRIDAPRVNSRVRQPLIRSVMN